MTDSEYMILSCPNGHEIQAAKSDFNKKLACPVCSVHFVPNEVRSSAQSPTPHATASESDFQNLQPPPDRPAITIWMLICWALVLIMWLANSLAILLGGPSFANKLQENPSASIVVGGLVCLAILAIPIGWILHLIWIYRIHTDASQRLRYRTMAPVPAVVLSIIPILNLLLNAILIERLSAFCDKSARAKCGNSGTKRFNSRAFALITLAALFIATMGLVGAFMHANQISERVKAELPTELQDLTKRENQVKLQQEVVKELPQWFYFAIGFLPLAAFIPYWIAVRRLENSLYFACGSIINQ